jgi:hypothetical protein
MFRKTSLALAATLVLGSASLALADDYTDLAADAIHANPQVTQQLSTRHVALPQSRAAASQNWMERASQTVDGGY